MEKIIRTMDQFTTWNDIALINSMEIKILNYLLEEDKFSIEFTISKKKVYSYVKQKVTLSENLFKNFNFNHFNQKEFQEFNIFLSDWKNKIKIKQKIYMSYANEEEAQLFNLDIGEKIVIIDKEIKLENYLIIEETEVNKSESSIFREGYI